jgi:hypothetical protein
MIRKWFLQATLVSLAMHLASSVVLGQVTTPNRSIPPPDDTPSVRVGGTIFLDYTHTSEPEITDADGNVVSPSSFNVARTYINVTGQLNHLFQFRITPDITRETSTSSALAGSMTFRLKYGFLQFNLDDWLWRENATGTSYVRVGMIQTPYVEFEEGVYRYRFQGPVFVDRERYLTSADFGAAFRTQLPGGYAEIFTGYYNGEGYNRADPNDQKAFQIRGSLRPFPNPGVFRGLRLTAFYDKDHYIKDADRNRFVSLVSFEHRFLHAGWSYLDAVDQETLARPRIDASGHSIWFTPRWQHGSLPPAPASGQVRAWLEGLVRYDRLEPDQSTERVKDRWITGVAYWPRMPSSRVTLAALLNFEQVRYENYTPAVPTEKRLALHMLVNF